MQRLALIASSLVLAAAGCGGDDADSGEREGAIVAAQDAYDRAVEEGMDLDSGPCIAEELDGAPGWVADIAHDPREPVDDEEENQCAAYREGEASHFVELSPEGEVLRAE